MEKDPEEIMKKAFANIPKFLSLVVAILIVVGMTYPAFAQVVPPGGNPCPGGPPCNPEEVPISGIEWLLVAGGLFGFRKIYQKFRKV